METGVKAVGILAVKPVGILHREIRRGVIVGLLGSAYSCYHQPAPSCLLLSPSRPSNSHSFVVSLLL